MFEFQGLHDPWFLTLYCVAGCLAMGAALWLLLRRRNLLAPGVTPPVGLRRWAAAFLGAAALSHVWWFACGQWWLTDDRLVRNIVAILLDNATLVPLVMAVLLAMLQDRRRPLWLWWLVQVPVLVFGVMGITRRDGFYGYTLTYYWQLAAALCFVVYYAFQLRQYGRWLRHNYADLEHKEVWQSLAFALALFVVYELYTSNMGQLPREYLSQVLTLVIVAFLVWRVETLQELEE